MAEINWNILDPNAPAKAGLSVQAGADNALSRRQAEQQSALQSMQMQQMQQSVQDKNALRNIYQRSGGDMNQTLTALKQSGNMEQAMALESKMQEQQKGKIAQAIEVEKLKRDLSMEVYANPSAQTAIAALTHLQQITGQDLSQDIAKVQASSPQQIQQWARGHIMTAEQMLPKLMQINQGGQTSVVPMDPMSGQQVGQGTSFQNTSDPNKDPGSGYRTSKVGEDGTVYVYENGRWITAKNESGEVIRDFSAVPDVQRDLSKSKAGGKASAERESKSIDASKKASQISTQLDKAESLLGLGPTSSGVGTLVDKAGTLIGKSTTSGNVAAELETLSGWLVSNVPRMEGPQSNYDVENYKTMAADVGNSRLPVETRLAKVKLLKGLQEDFEKINQKFRESGATTGGSQLPATGGQIKFLGFE